MTRKVLAIGDSHVGALKEALADFAPEKTVWTALRLSKIKGGRDIGDLSLAEAILQVRGLGPDDAVVCAVGGNQHQAISLIRHPRPFDFALPGEPFTPAPGCETIPYRAVEALFVEGLREGDFNRIMKLRDAAQGEVIQLAPPPPKQDEAHILRSLDTYFIEKGLVELGVADPAIRLRMWRLQMKVLGDLCAEGGVTLLPNPPETLTSEGFLAPDYYAQDATHANSAYGRCVIRQIETHLAARAASVTEPDA